MMPIDPITSGASAVRAAPPALPGLPALPDVPAVEDAGGDQRFGDALLGAVENLQATQTRADGLAVAAATGQLTDVHDYMIAATEASLAMELTVAVRNRAIDAFNQIMQMQV